ncbi:MAG: SPOR domain-containing protein, partial [Terriglobales bacterium]
REVISPRLDLLQLVTYSNGQATVSFGGNFNTNRLSVGVDYQTVYVPFLASAFKQALMLRIRFRPFGNLELSTQTYVAPDGRLRYTAAGNTFLYRYQGLVTGERNAPFNLPRHMARGRVVDETGDPIRGAALRIDRHDVFTDASGQFFVRLAKAREYPVEVLVDEFLVPGYFEVVDAPASVRADAEERAPEITIVVRRTRPPQVQIAAGQARQRPVSPQAPAATPKAATVAALERSGLPPVPSKIDGAGDETLVGDEEDAPVHAQPPIRQGFAVQVAALSHSSSAEALVEKLRLLRYPVYVIGGHREDELYRVQVGPFLDREQARSTSSRLKREGYKPILKSMTPVATVQDARKNQGD